MRVEILPFDPSKRRSREGSVSKGVQTGQVLSFERLSDGVIQRVIRRQAQRELEQLKFMLKVTGGYLEFYPSQDQIQAFYEDGLEY